MGPAIGLPGLFRAAGARALVDAGVCALVDAGACALVGNALVDNAA